MAKKNENNIDAEELAGKSVFDELYEELALERQLKEIAEVTLAKERTRSESFEKLLNKLQADFDNHRKRTAETQKKSEEDGMFKVLEKVLSVFDIMEQAKQMIGDKKVNDGLDMVVRNLESSILAPFGVTEIPALGEDFDPNLHNAVQMVKAKNADEAGKVVEVFNRGFRMGERVIRHSVVKVAN